jgi:hypothetical protein
VLRELDRACLGGPLSLSVAVLCHLQGSPANTKQQMQKFKHSTESAAVQALHWYNLHCMMNSVFHVKLRKFTPVLPSPASTAAQGEQLAGRPLLLLLLHITVTTPQRVCVSQIYAEHSLVLVINSEVHYRPTFGSLNFSVNRWLGGPCCCCAASLSSSTPPKGSGSRSFMLKQGGLLLMRWYSLP